MHNNKAFLPQNKGLLGFPLHPLQLCREEKSTVKPWLNTIQLQRHKSQRFESSLDVKLYPFKQLF